MNNKLLSFAAAAATLLAFAACNKVDVQNPDVTNMETAYAKVKISMGKVGTRSFDQAEEGDHYFDKGTAAEAKINNLTVLLFDDNKNMVGVGSTNGFEANTDRTGSTSVSDEKVAVIPVKITPGSAEPKTMLAFVNTTASFETLAAAAANKTADFGKVGEFVMTNAGYYDDDVWTTAVSCEDLIYETEEEATTAEDGTITVYVERVAAKVTVDQDEDIVTTADIKILGVDGKTEYKIEFDPYHWAATGTARESYSLKQAFSTSLNTWANDATKYRSYWAQDVLSDKKYEDYSAEPRPLKYLTANQIVSDKGVGLAFGKDPFYIHEHTLGSAVVRDSKFNAVAAATNAIVVGQYKVLDEEGASADAFKTDNDEYDFYLAMTGDDEYVIYSEKDLVKRIFEISEAKVSTESGSEAEEDLIKAEAAADYFTVQKDGNQYRLALKTETPLYVGETQLSKDNIKDNLTGASNAKHYFNGWAYFFAPIMHNGDCGTVNAPAEGFYGIVRNHSYQLTVKEIIGLGAPLDEGKIGPDPKGSDPKDPDEDPDPDPEPGDDPIVPDPDETKNAWINATLKVLSWHVVDQNVRL